MDAEVEAEIAEQMDAAEPLLALFHQGWRNSVARYDGTDYSDLVRAQHDETAAANCIRCHMYHEVAAFSADMPGLRLENYNGFKLLINEDRQVWRFKRVDHNGMHSNVRTGQQDDFDDQKDIPGLPSEAVRLTSGYHNDAAGEGIRVIVSRVIGRQVYWAVQVNVINQVAQYEPITNPRFAGTWRQDFDAQRVRRRRRAR